MKRMALMYILTIFILAAAGAALAQTSPEDQEKARQAYAAAGAVTENHKLLHFYVGKWDVTTIMWEFPGAPGQTSQGSAEVFAILGGRFIMSQFSGTVMGAPFEGGQIDGYDNIRKKFQTLWIDSTSTAFFFLDGAYDPAAKAWTLTGRWADPMGGVSPVRLVNRIVGPDEYVSEMWMGLPDGKEFKSMENRYVRKK